MHAVKDLVKRNPEDPPGYVGEHMNGCDRFDAMEPVRPSTPSRQLRNGRREWGRRGI